MSYTKTAWVNDSAPALSADNLNKIENQLEAVTALAEAALPASQKGAASGVATLGADSLLEQAVKKLFASSVELTIGSIADGQYLKRDGDTIVGGSPAGGGNMDTSVYDQDEDGIVDAAASVPWSGVTDKPSTFAPSAHSHTQTDIDGLSDALAGKANASHSHDTSDIVGLQTELNNKAPMSHTHTIGQVDGLQAALDNLADSSGAGYVENDSPIFTDIVALDEIHVGADSGSDRHGTIYGEGTSDNHTLYVRVGNTTLKSLALSSLGGITWDGTPLVLDTDPRLDPSQVFGTFTEVLDSTTISDTHHNKIVIYKTDNGDVTFTLSESASNGFHCTIINTTASDITFAVEGTDTMTPSGAVLKANPNGLAVANVMHNAGAWYVIAGKPPKESFIVALSDMTSDLSVGTNKASFRMPYDFYVTEVRAAVATAPVGSKVTVDINESGTSILSTKLSIDAGEKTSVTAEVPAVLSYNLLAEDAEITFDIDGVGSTTAGAGLTVTLLGYRV